MQHAQLIRRFESEKLPLAFEAKTNSFRSLTELTLVTRDHPRLLKQFAGACATSGANISSAQISTTRDGLALDTLVLQRMFANEEEEINQSRKIAGLIGEVISGKRALEAPAFRRPVAARLEAFSVPPDVVLDNTASQELTVIEVHARDRAGLLFDLARELSDLGLDIASAHIATFGERAVDVFYVRDRFGKKVTNDDAKRYIRERLLPVLAQG